MICHDKWRFFRTAKSFNYMYVGVDLYLNMYMYEANGRCNLGMQPYSKGNMGVWMGEWKVKLKLFCI